MGRLINISAKSARSHLNLIVKRSLMNSVRVREMCDLTRIFVNAVDSVKPGPLIRKCFKLDKNLLCVDNKKYIVNGNVRVVGFGKAVFGMACEVEQALGGLLTEGVISVPLGTQDNPNSEHILPRDSVINVYEGAKYNLPDADSELAADKVMKVAQQSQGNDLLIVLVSGGGSALLPKPAGNITLQDKALTTKLLASAGADIMELNIVRQRLSVVKGGGLAQLSYPCPTVSLILSDIINDPIELIASGPTVPKRHSSSAAMEIIRKYKLELKIPRHVLKVISADDAVANIPVENGSFVHVNNIIIGNNSIACQSAVDMARSLGYNSLLLSASVTGLGYEVASFYSKVVVQICKHLHDSSSQLHSLLRGSPLTVNPNFQRQILSISSDVNKICLVAGGETTVKVTGQGKGGRSQELALWFSQFMYNQKENNDNLLSKYDISFLSAGTDGYDGPTDAAGAFGSSPVYESALKSGLNPDTYLANNDSYNFYSTVDNGQFLLKTGHTGTNVMDLHLITISKKNI